MRVIQKAETSLDSLFPGSRNSLETLKQGGGAHQGRAVSRGQYGGVAQLVRQKVDHRLQERQPARRQPLL